MISRTAAATVPAAPSFHNPTREVQVARDTGDANQETSLGVMLECVGAHNLEMSAVVDSLEKLFDRIAGPVPAVVTEDKESETRGILAEIEMQLRAQHELIQRLERINQRALNLA